MPAAAPLDAPTATLDAELNARVDPKAPRYWASLMKGEAAFRGVPMAGIRAAVRRVWVAHGLTAWPVGDLLALAQRWFAGPDSETQLAAVLLLAEHAAGRLRLEHAGALAAPRGAGRVREAGPAGRRGATDGDGAAVAGAVPAAVSVTEPARVREGAQRCDA